MNKKLLAKYTGYLLASSMLLNGFCVASNKKSNKYISINNTNYYSFLNDITTNKSIDDIKREADFKKIFFDLNQKYLLKGKLKEQDLNNFTDQNNKDFVRMIIEKALTENYSLQNNIFIKEDSVELVSDLFYYKLYNFANEYDEFKISFPFQYTITYIPAIRNLIIDDMENHLSETMIIDENSLEDLAKIFNNQFFSIEELKYRINNLIKGIDPFSLNAENIFVNENKKVFKDELIKYLNTYTDKNFINNNEYLYILDNLMDENSNINTILESYIGYSLSKKNHYKLTKDKTFVSSTEDSEIILSKDSLSVASQNNNLNIDFINYLDDISNLEIQSEVSNFVGVKPVISLNFNPEKSILLVNLNILGIENNYATFIDYDIYPQLIDFYLNFNKNWQLEDIYTFYYRIVNKEDKNSKENAIQTLKEIIMESMSKAAKNWQKMNKLRNYYFECIDDFQEIEFEFEEYLLGKNNLFDGLYIDLYTKLKNSNENAIEGYSSSYLRKVIYENYDVHPKSNYILAYKDYPNYKEIINIEKNRLFINKGNNSFQIISNYSDKGDWINDIYKLSILNSSSISSDGTYTFIFNNIEYNPIEGTIRYNINGCQNIIVIDTEFDDSLVIKFMADFSYDTKPQELFNLLYRISNGKDEYIRDLAEFKLNLIKL